MCGIAGYFNLTKFQPPDKELIRKMVQIIRHRGPDEFGAYFDNKCVLGQARLSIIDLSSGSQPMCNENGSIWISYNGEIFNYLELRKELLAVGHKFKTKSDTEVIIHAYEEYGVGCLEKFNGQFAFAIYDKNKKSLFVARDRMGIRPVYYTIHNNKFYFASEIKSLFCEQSIPRGIDYKGLSEIFTWWTTSPPRTVFENINELEAGHYLLIKDGEIKNSKYWSIDYPEEYDRNRSISSWAEELHELLVDSVRLRLRADVPVGAYLSGGLDSSVTTALIKKFTTNKLETFSVAFHDKAYDESEYQSQMAEFLGTNHHQVKCSYDNIAQSFPSVIYHTEKPIVRTAPTPLYLLSKLVNDANFKVVLTGEGADEIFAGYDIFKETMIRKFWAKNPESSWRPMLLKKLYPTLPLSGARAKFYLETFYKNGLSEIDKYYFSHIPRINTTSKIKDFFSCKVKDQIRDHDTLNAFGTDLPENFFKWHNLSRAQFIEAKSLLAGYLLSSQGDRVSAANSVEGRFPFLDHRLVEFATKIPPWHKLLGLKEKYVLKQAMKKELPKEIIERVKQPYMAPDSNCFFQENKPGYIDYLMSDKMIDKYGIFNSKYTDKLVNKCSRLVHAHLSFKDNMSFIGILSTQLLIDKFIDNFEPVSVPLIDKFKVWYDDCSV